MTEKLLVSKRRLHLEKNYLLILAFLTFIYATFTPAKEHWWTDYIYLLGHQTYLLHDFFEVAGVSATFVNVAIHFAVAYILNVRNNLIHLTGFQLAAIGIFVGHAFFGTHLVNILPIILGVVIYARRTGHSFKIYTNLSLFATSTAPIVSFVMFSQGVSVFSVFLGIGVGLLLGYITPPLAEEFIKFHRGYTLYNAGFTCGIIGLFAYVVLRYLGYDVPTVFVLSTEAHNYLLCFISFLNLSLLCLSLIGMNYNESVEKFLKLNRRVGRLPDDFLLKYGWRVAFFNMGLMGIVYSGLILAFGITLNGPIAGGIVSIIGFSAFGKHLRNTLPIAAGVIVAAYFSENSFTTIGFPLSLLFGTALAPLAGYYGLIVGMIAGFFQFNITQSVIGLHFGLSLYNNGFSSGFIAAFLTTIAENSIGHKPKLTKNK